MRKYIIPIFIPHSGCPHQCVFCNQHHITGVYSQVRGEDVKKTIEKHLSQITREYQIEVAFYGGTFTALEKDLQKELLYPATRALKKGKINAIRLSTRPDCIDEEILAYLKEAGVKTIELGVQSFADEVLKASGRGHTANDAHHAAKLIKKSGISLGIQLMLGLPAETKETLQKTLHDTLLLKPDIVRLYPTLVLIDTPLSEMYKRGEYTPLRLDDAVHIAAVFKHTLEQKQITVIRTGLQSSEELDDTKTVLQGAYHPAFGELVENEIYWEMIKKLIEKIGKTKNITLYVKERELSKLRGIKNCNIKRLQTETREAIIKVVTAPITYDLMIAADKKLWAIKKSALQLRL